MKKRILILLGIIIIVGAAAGVCWKLGVFGGGSDSGDETTTASGDETTTASGDETTTAPSGGNGNNTGNIPQTGSDNGMVAAFAVCAVAAGAFIVLSKKKEA